MHVLMLGWEFPPYITGGLGTACHGLTRALDAHDVRITFVIPKTVSKDDATHVNLLGPDPAPGTPGSPGSPGSAPPAQDPPAPAEGNETAAPPTGFKPHEQPPHPQTAQPQPNPEDPALVVPPGTPGTSETWQHMQFLPVHSGFLHPYPSQPADQPVGQPVSEDQPARTSSPPKQPAQQPADQPTTPDPPKPDDSPGSDSGWDKPRAQTDQSSNQPTQPQQSQPAPASTTDYDGDVVTAAERYATFCIAAIEQRNLDFDVIHAHDWMTYPAGLAIARLTGKPLVVHIHSTEFDRSGEHINQRVYDIERRGMHDAMRVIAVSQLTRNMVVKRYGVPQRRVEVVYNGVEFEPTDIGMSGIEQQDKIVLYFGRITYQKGPEYFIRAAKRVLDYRQDVKFVVAGSGDLAQHMMQMAADLGIGDRVLFTGFLRGKDIPRVFAMADLYVMPSITEPFGIAPLEAMSHDVPVLISKSSGVSEVITHALKVDFWDVDDMANKIIAVLSHPPLSNTLREHGAMEVRTITWDGAATRCEQIYSEVIREMTTPPKIETVATKKRKAKSKTATTQPAAKK